MTFSLPSPSSDLKVPILSCSLYLIWYPVLTLDRGRSGYDITFLRATRGARNPNLQVVITHASHVCCQHSFGLPLRMNGMHKTQLNVQRCCLPTQPIAFLPISLPSLSSLLANFFPAPRNGPTSLCKS